MITKEELQGFVLIWGIWGGIVVATLAFAVVSALIIISIATFASIAVSIIYWRLPSEKGGIALSQAEPAPTFSSQVSDPRLAALRGGEGSILIHLYAFEHWLEICKGFTSPIGTRAEYDQKNPLSEDIFGHRLSTKEVLKQMADREEAYGNQMANIKINRELGLGIEKMKSSIQPAFEKAFPGQLDEVIKSANAYIKEASDLDKSTGMVGAFLFGSTMASCYEQIRLIREQIDRLRKVFSKDEPVMVLLNNLKEEHRAMLERASEIASDKSRRSLPF